MTTRVADIITNARDILSDLTTGGRYSNEYLLRLLTTGQKELALKAKLLRTKSTHYVRPNKILYDSPDDCRALTRVLANGKKIDFKSHEEMDDLADRGRISIGTEGWENAEGDKITHLVFDKLAHSTYKLYPIVEDEFTYEAATQVPEDTSYNTIYGIMVTIPDYTPDSDYGVIASFNNGETNTFENDDEDTDEDTDGVYGIVTAFQEDPVLITLYYVKKPTKVTALTGELEVDELWDTGLEHYIAGMALRADKDTQNRAMGNEELQFYYDYVNDAKAEASKNFVGTKTQYDVPYVQGV